MLPDRRYQLPTSGKRGRHDRSHGARAHAGAAARPGDVPAPCGRCRQRAGLLFTILGEFVLPGGGQAWTSALIGTMARLGVEEKSTRQALMRTAADGWLQPERLGRRTRWRLTPSADRLLTEGTDRIYGFGAHRERLGRQLATGAGPRRPRRTGLPGMSCAAG